MKVFLGSRLPGESLDYVVPTHFDGWRLVSINGFITAGAVAETPTLTIRDTNGFAYMSKVSATQIAALAGATIQWGDFGSDTVGFAAGSQFLALPPTRVNESDVISINVAGTSNVADAYMVIEPATIDESLVL